MQEARILSNVIEQVQPQIESKQFEEVESTWMGEIERNPLRVDQFLEIAKRLRKAEERTRADALLELLAESLREQDAWRERLVVLRELARLSRRPATFRSAIQESLEKAYGDREIFPRVMKATKFGQSDDVATESEKVEIWMSFDKGEYFFMAGRGPGVVIELNPDLGICRLDFEREKRVSVPLGAAMKFLSPLGEGHFLRGRFTDPEGFAKRVLSKPAESLEELLQSFGRAMSASEVKEALVGVVPDGRWNTWWTAARKSQRVVAHGSGARATYTWTASSEAADDSIKRRFEKASLRNKLDLAKKHSGRGQELADQFSSTLAREAEKVSRTEPALAWEIFATLQRLPGTWDSPTDPDELLMSANASRVVSEISDRQLRESAIQVIRENHSEWPKVLAEVFFQESDPRVIGIIDQALTEGGETEIRERLIEETLRYPRRHPRAFYWYLTRLEAQEEIPEKRASEIMQHALDAVSHDDFAALRPRLKELFDKGGLGVRIINTALTEDQARKVVENLDRHTTLEEYRREILKNTALMRYPALREPQVEPVFATAESLKAKREEFDRLKTVEMPANLKAIQEAREMGDLRENFEYKAARQRQEYLTSRIGELQSEMQRVRVIDPAEVDTSEIRVGTSVALSNGDMHRKVTILGPWESDPEQGVYSNQSEVARALIGHGVGDIVSFMGNDYRVDSIERWESGN